MSASGDEDYEHWPSDNQRYAASVAPSSSSGYHVANGLSSFTYIAAKSKAKSPTPEPARKDSKSPSPVPQAPVVNYPQPVYYAHPPHMMAHPNSQYYSHPVPIYTAPQGYYASYANPSPASAPAPAPAPAMASGHSNMHTYIPAYSQPKPAPAPEGPKPNAWLGRTKAQVEEDNMKIAKNEGAYGPRKVAPVDLAPDQPCWVVELDGSNTLRLAVDIKGLTGTWKPDPRFPDSWYFVREEENKKG